VPKRKQNAARRSKKIVSPRHGSARAWCRHVLRARVREMALQVKGR